WSNLQGEQSDGAVPAIGDMNSIVWAMGKKIGDSIDLVDEHGKPFKVRLIGGLANSILQGSLLISEEEFVRRFPGQSGYRMFLIDAPSNHVAAVRCALTRALQDAGLQLTPAAQRAILPALLVPGAEVHYFSLAATLCAVLFSGLLWTWLATRLALRGDLLKALRNE